MISNRLAFQVEHQDDDEIKVDGNKKEEPAGVENPGYENSKL